MLFDLEPLIQKALTDNPQITAYVAKIGNGYPNIGANYTPHGIFPLIEYHQIYGSDHSFGDDSLLSRQYSFQVGIYSENADYYLIQDELDNCMREQGWTCYNDYTYFVDESGIYHRIFSYTITLTLEMYQELQNKYLNGE